ncbi:MAG: class D sortase [Acidobacteriota bacterium]|nr:class D sortase [Acidobacteriota bacterium]
MPEKAAAARNAYTYRPGLHSHNVARLDRELQRPQAPFRRLKIILVLVGVLCLCLYGYSVCDQYVYQAYENWAFDQQIAGRATATFSDYLRERTPIGLLFGPKAVDNIASPRAVQHVTTTENRPAEGEVIGRVSLARLNLSAIIREGVSDRTLSVAVGHVPTTALPGQSGNFALAAHRDTLFRALKDVHLHDLVTVQSPSSSFQYEVLATKIVQPSDVSVLRSDGGGLIASSDRAPEKLLTLITCYPFRYVGSAPKRFIVEARVVSDEPHAPSQIENVISHVPLRSPVPHVSIPRSLRGPRSVEPKPKLKHSARSTKGRRTTADPRVLITKPVRRQHWWQKIFQTQ